MKISTGYILKRIAEKNIVVSVGDNAEFKGMITLNETGAFFWELLEKGTTIEKMLEKVVEEYDVSSEKASKDINNFIEKLQYAFQRGHK